MIEIFSLLLIGGYWFLVTDETHYKKLEHKVVPPKDLAHISATHRDPSPSISSSVTSSRSASPIIMVNKTAPIHRRSSTSRSRGLSVIPGEGLYQQLDLLLPNQAERRETQKPNCFAQFFVKLFMPSWPEED